jgi:hypothetical protein
MFAGDPVDGGAIRVALVSQVEQRSNLFRHRQVGGLPERVGPSSGVG